MQIFTWDEIQIFTFFHVLVRVTSFIVFLPIFGDRAVPAIVKVLLGLSLSIVIHPIVWAQGLRVMPEVFNSQTKLIGSVMGEVAFGILAGYVARWVFDAVQFSGHLVATTMGFSMASIMDPHTETQTTAIAELQYVMAAMLFLALDGHHIYLQAVLDSFKILPFAGSKILMMNEGMGNYLIRMTAEVLTLGVKLSAPILVVIFIINMTFGMLARAVPQLNFLVVSFAANIIIGMFIVIISLPAFMSMVNTAFDTYTPEIMNFMKLLGT